MSLDMKANKLQEIKTTALPIYVVSSLTVHNPLAFLFTRLVIELISSTLVEKVKMVGMLSNDVNRQVQIS